MDVGTFNDNLQENKVPSWLIPCVCATPRWQCHAKFKLNISYIKNLPYQSPFQHILVQHSQYNSLNCVLQWQNLLHKQVQVQLFAPTGAGPWNPGPTYSHVSHTRPRPVTVCISALRKLQELKCTLWVDDVMGGAKPPSATWPRRRTARKSGADMAWSAIPTATQEATFTMATDSSVTGLAFQHSTCSFHWALQFQPLCTSSRFTPAFVNRVPWSLFIRRLPLDFTWVSKCKHVRIVLEVVRPSFLPSL